MNNASALRIISEKEFLRNAWKAISKKNMRSKGLDNVTIKAFKGRLDEHLEQISRELREKTYTFNKLRAHAIQKAGSKKLRPLQIATVRDRVVMKALALFIEPSFHKFNLESSFAFIRNRGVKKAIERVHDYVSRGKKFYFEADIINFFGAVDREVLWVKFSKKVRSKSLLPLLRQCFNLELGNLESFRDELQELFYGAESGIPQGGVLSPMLANFYLYEFDLAMKNRGLNLVRYADDFVVFCDSPEEAHQAHEFCRASLKSLGLEIHSLDAPDSKSRFGNFSKDGIVFLGVRFEGEDTFPTKKVVKKFEEKVSEVLKLNSGNSLFKTLQQLGNLINGWGNCYKFMKVNDIYLRLDDFLKTHLQIYLNAAGVRLVGKNRRKQMKFLGVPSLSAMVQHCKDLQKNERESSTSPFKS